MSLIFNMLFSLVIPFLPRSKDICFDSTFSQTSLFNILSCSYNNFIIKNAWWLHREMSMIQQLEFFRLIISIKEYRKGVTWSSTFDPLLDMWLVPTWSKLSQGKTEDSINLSQQTFLTYLLFASQCAMCHGRSMDEKDTPWSLRVSHR